MLSVSLLLTTLVVYEVVTAVVEGVPGTATAVGAIFDLPEGNDMIV